MDGALVPAKASFRLRDEASGKVVTVRQVQSIAVLANPCPCCGNPVEHLIDGDTEPTGDWTESGPGAPSLLCRPCEVKFLEHGDIDRVAHMNAERDRMELATHFDRVDKVYRVRARELRLSYRRARIDDVEYRESILALNAWRRAEQPKWTPQPDRFPVTEPEDDESPETAESLRLELEPPVFSDDVERGIASMNQTDIRAAVQAEYHADKATSLLCSVNGAKSVRKKLEAGADEQ